MRPRLGTRARATARAWAELLRLPALFTVPGDALTGAAAAGARPGPRTLLAIGSSVCLYEAGMALNDWADRAEDAVERPHRPLPSGRVRPASALLAAGLLTAAGLALAARAGRSALAVAVPLAATVWAYDLTLKHTPAGPAAMGAARGLDLLLGAAATTGGTRGALPSALVLGTHTFAVTTVSRGETRGGSHLAPLAALATTAALTWDLTRSRAGVHTPPATPADAARQGPATGPHVSAAGEGKPDGPHLTAARQGRTSVPGPGVARRGRTAASGKGVARRGRTAARGEGVAGKGAAPGPDPSVALKGGPAAPHPGAARNGEPAGLALTVARTGPFAGSGPVGVALQAWRPRPGRSPYPSAHDALRAALTVGYAATAARPLLHAALNPSPPLTQRAVGGGIRALIPLQAALTARAGAPAVAFLTAALAPAARTFARKVSVT
ncbi:SCO3242 family prenyltransferase [Streptomyces sp. NPDC004082]